MGLLSYAVAELHDHVVEQAKKYSVVWVQANDQRMWSLSMWRFKRSMHPMFFENVHEVHVVHPSWGLRFYVLLLWPTAEESFWDRFISHERVEFLSSHLRVPKLMLPADIMEYDKDLDREPPVMMPEHAGLVMNRDAGFSSDPAYWEREKF